MSKTISINAYNGNSWVKRHECRKPIIDINNAVVINGDEQKKAKTLIEKNGWLVEI